MSYVSNAGRRLYLASPAGVAALARAVGHNFGAPPVTGGGMSIAVTEWPRDNFAFDSGAFRGQNSANIPVRVTATAGQMVEARLIPTNGGVGTAWADVGTASGGANQLVGYYTYRKHSSPLLLQVRLKASPATIAITSFAITIGHVVAIWGQSEHAQWQDVSAGSGGTPLTPETIAIKNAVTALPNQWAAGRRPTAAALKVPGVDALPTGISRSGTDINITGTFLVLNNWDFTGYKVWGRSGCFVGSLEDCVFGERTGLADLDTYLFVEVGGYVLAERNDFTGWDGLANPDISNNLGAPKAARAEILGSGAGITVGSLHIRRCRFTNLPSDALKVSGCASEPQSYEWNYFGPAVAFGNDRAAYDNARTYVKGEVCDNAAGESFICRLATSLGTAPSTGTASNANWAWVDPHSDTIQFPAAKNGASIRFNYIDSQTTARNRGINSSLFIARDANAADRQFDKVYVEWNYLPVSLGTNGSILITAGSGTNPMTTPTIRNNWIGRRIAGTLNPYLKDGSLNGAFEFGGNRAIDTDALIPASSFTNAIDVPALAEFADSRITHLWHDAGLGAGAAGIRHRTSTVATPYTAALAAITNAVLSVVGDDFVTFVHHTVSGTTWVECLNDAVGRPWNNDYQLHLYATGSGLSQIGAVYASWYAAPSTFKDDYGKAWAISFLGKNTDGSDFTTPGSFTYGIGGASSQTLQRTFAQLYDWTYTKAILPDAHPFVITAAASPMTWSESGTGNYKDKRRCTTSIRLMQALPAMSGYFTKRPFAPNAYHSGFPQTAGNFDPAGTGHGDEPHPNKWEDRGQNTFARMTAYAILQAADLLPIPVPEFDQVTLQSDASVLRVGSSAGPITTIRAKNSETSISGTSATDHWTDVMGFEYSGAPVYQALLKPDGKVYVYPRSGTLPTSGPTIPNGVFTPGSTGMTFGMGGATGGLNHPTDNLTNLERNYPIVDFNLLGIEGVPVRQAPSALEGAHPTGTFTVP